MTDDQVKAWLRFKDNKRLIREIWDIKYPTLKLTNLGEAAYVFKYGASPFCPENNHRHFKQFPKGYFNACGDNCKCHHNTRSSATKKFNENLTESQRKEIKDKAKNTNKEKYGISLHLIDYKKLYHRYEFAKYKLVAQGYDSSKTEWEIMQDRNFDRYWDCGQSRLVWGSKL